MVKFTAPDNKNKPLHVTIAGDPGIGKTTLGATFLKPAIIKLEDGTRAIKGDFVETPVLDTYSQVIEAITVAGKDPNIKSLIIDSVSTLEILLENEIVKSDPNATSINDALQGWGRGPRAVASMMGQIKQACVDTGKNCIYLCHPAIKQYSAVDMEPYNILDLRLSTHTLPHFVDLVDCVAFLRLKVRDQRKNRGGDKIVLSSSSRELICYAHATIKAKNRLGITKPLDCPEGVNPIVNFIKGNQQKGE